VLKGGCGASGPDPGFYPLVAAPFDDYTLSGLRTEDSCKL
jgi:hypothetical protein